MRANHAVPADSGDIGEEKPVTVGSAAERCDREISNGYAPGGPNSDALASAAADSILFCSSRNSA